MPTVLDRNSAVVKALPASVEIFQDTEITESPAIRFVCGCLETNFVYLSFSQRPGLFRVLILFVFSFLRGGADSLIFPLSSSSNGFQEDPQKYLASFLTESVSVVGKRPRDENDDFPTHIVRWFFFGDRFELLLLFAYSRPITPPLLEGSFCSKIKIICKQGPPVRPPGKAAMFQY